MTLTAGRTNDQQSVSQESLAQEIGKLKLELAKRKEFTHDELECLKEALEEYDSPNYSEEFQRGLLMKLLYEE